MGVPACCAAQSACYGLRYRFGAVRTMLTHALRMPNAKEVFFWGFWVYPPTRPRVKELKTRLFTYVAYVCARIRVRDSSGKPAVSEANEVQAWHATSLPAYSPTRSEARDTP